MKSLIITLAMLIAGSSAVFAQQEPPNGMGELQAYAVFMDAYKGDDYDMAINFGAWMIEAKPEKIEGHDGFDLLRQFDRMVKVYKGAAENESDPTSKSEYMKKAVDVFDQAFETFSEDEMDQFEWKLKLGRFYHENNSALNVGTSQIAEKYEEAYEEDPERFANASDGYFAGFLLDRYASQGQRDKAFAMIDEIESYATPDLQNKITSARESLFDGPEERIEFYESQLADAGDSEKEQLLTDLVNLYEETSEGDKAADAAIQLYELNSTYANTRKVASIYLDDGEYEAAIEFLEESFEKAENDADKKEISLELAETHQQLEEFRQARQYARQAIDIDSNYGEAYMRVAAIYAASISECTGGQALEREDRTVYWLVVDYLNKAKEADPSLASNANNRAESYSSAMPTSEDKFFKGWEAGDNFRINGEVRECYAWIDEATTVK
ncbi:tetratricopeptide repeat protein [Rhodohalobacter barkolensis]|nr:tetratricopeptide repeat protein [Rhodohalobacter barkolensis]